MLDELCLDPVKVNNVIETEPLAVNSVLEEAYQKQHK